MMMKHRIQIAKSTCHNNSETEKAKMGELVKCADCWHIFLNKDCLIKHLKYCGLAAIKQENNEIALEKQSTKETVDVIQGPWPKQEHDLKAVIVKCEESVNFVTSLQSRDSYVKEPEVKCKCSEGSLKHYQCEECRYTSCTPSALLAHLETHNTDKMFKCPLCTGCYSYFWSLNYHLAWVHFDERVTRCLECGDKCCCLQNPDRFVSCSSKANCCTSCPESFSNKESLETCGMVHCVACEFCGKMFLSGTSKVHYETCCALVTTASDVEPQLPKDARKQKLNKAQTLRQPLRKPCRGEKTVPHYIHERKFAKKGMAAENEMIETREKPYSCDFCEKKFSRSQHKVSHMRIHTREKPYSCDFCEKVFSRPQEKVSHMRLHTGEKPYACDFCEKRFSQSQHKVRHMRTHTGEKPYSCEFCEKRFSDRTGKICHTRLHTGEKPYSCDFCENRFSQSHQKVSHMRLHTGDKPYSCNFCEKRFSLLQHKVAHMRIHTGEKPYSCDFCEKRFSQSHSKASHMRLHTGQKSYSCDFCEKRFSHSGNKVIHMRLHTGEKPYCCNFCLKRFSDPTALVGHMRLHTGEKPYPCDFCEKRFSQSQSKVIHMRLHTGEKPYPCDLCDKRFSRSDTRVAHLRTHI